MIEHSSYCRMNPQHQVQNGDASRGEKRGKKPIDDKPCAVVRSTGDKRPHPPPHILREQRNIGERTLCHPGKHRQLQQHRAGNDRDLYPGSQLHSPSIQPDHEQPPSSTCAEQDRQGRPDKTTLRLGETHQHDSTTGPYHAHRLILSQLYRERSSGCSQPGRKKRDGDRRDQK